MRWWLVLIAGCSASDLPDTDMWCGDHLCTWSSTSPLRYVQGPDSAHNAIGLADGAAISLVPPFDGAGPSCLELALAVRDPGGAGLTISVDIEDDGTVDSAEGFTNDDGWQELVVPFAMPAQLDGVRFTLANATSIEADVARATVRRSQACDATSKLVMRPDGASCAADTDCASLHCESLTTQHAVHAWTTAVCSPLPCGPLGTMCGMHEMCGDNHPIALGPLLTYVDPGRCWSIGGIGSPCDSGRPCGVGLTCGPFVPYACTDGRACLTDGDCPALADGTANRCGPLTLMTCR